MATRTRTAKKEEPPMPTALHAPTPPATKVAVGKKRRTSGTPYSGRARVPKSAPHAPDISLTYRVDADADAQDRARVNNLREGREKHLRKIQEANRERMATKRKEVGHFKQHVERRDIPLSVLLQMTTVDRANYQRNLDWKKVETIADKFMWVKFDPISINLRPDVDPVTKQAVAAITDGQHRLAAAEYVFSDTPGEMIPVDMTHVRGIEAEADIFIGKNQDRTGLSYTSELRARLTAKEARAEILRDEAAAPPVSLILRTTRTGLVPGGTRRAGEIVAGRSLERIMDAGGRKGLRDVLVLLKEAYGTDSTGYVAPIIDGVWEFLLRYHPIMDRERLLDVMRRANPDGLLRRAMDPDGSGNIMVVSVRGQHVGLALHYFYNYRLIESSKLPGFVMDSSAGGITSRKLVSAWRQTFGIELGPDRKAI